MLFILDVVGLFLGSAAIAGPPDFSACSGRAGQELGICKAWVAAECDQDHTQPGCTEISEINPGAPLPGEVACPCFDAATASAWVASHTVGFCDSRGDYAYVSGVSSDGCLSGLGARSDSGRGDGCFYEDAALEGGTCTRLSVVSFDAEHPSPEAQECITVLNSVLDTSVAECGD